MQSCPHLIGFVCRQPNARQQRRGRVSILLCVIAPRAIHRARQVDVVEALGRERLRVLRLARDELVPEEEGNQWSSEVIRGHQSHQSHRGART